MRKTRRIESFFAASHRSSCAAFLGAASCAVHFYLLATSTKALDVHVHSDGEMKSAIPFVARRITKAATFWQYTITQSNAPVSAAAALDLATVARKRAKSLVVASAWMSLSSTSATLNDAGAFLHASVFSCVGAGRLLVFHNNSAKITATRSATRASPTKGNSDADASIQLYTVATKLNCESPTKLN